GSLFILLYEDDNSTFLGLLKMDPNDGVQIHDDLSIEVRKDMLPSINEKLHKSALIELKEYKENEFHLYVLDKQQGVNEPAKYFIEYFLNAIELASDKNLTKYIQAEISSSFDQLIPAENIPYLNNNLKHAFIKKETFDIDVDLEPILKPLLHNSNEDLDLTESIEAFKDKILKTYPDATFKFKPDEVSVKEIIYRTPDKSVEIKFDPSLELGEDYAVDHEKNGDTIIKLFNGVGIDLKEVPTRRK
ncbi:nucleoid-associated protein, partial [Enterococcus faecalis]|nr:nucleoid-associated protein [Enterococcus faecalis]